MVASGISRTRCKQVRIITLHAELDGVAKTFLRSRWDWLDILQSQVELVGIFAGAGRTGVTFTGNEGKCKICKISQTFCESGCNLSNFSVRIGRRTFFRRMQD